jgi:hypothetical protein
MNIVVSTAFQLEIMPANLNIGISQMYDAFSTSFSDHLASYFQTWSEHNLSIVTANLNIDISQMYDALCASFTDHLISYFQIF